MRNYKEKSEEKATGKTGGLLGSKGNELRAGRLDGSSLTVTINGITQLLIRGS